MKRELQNKKDFTFEKRWAPELKADGFVQVSVFFLENYHRLKPYDLTHGEAMFIIHLMQHKWGVTAPFPAYKTIAKRMGVSTKTTRRYAVSLEQKRFLSRELRIGETNRFHLKNLMDALVRLRTGKAVRVKKANSKR
jgi:Helix-turn-helix domain